MRKALQFSMAVLAVVIVFLGCGGEKKLVLDNVGEGVKVSYAPAVGTTRFYRSDSDNLTEFTQEGYHQSTLSKTTEWKSFRVDSVKNDVTAVTYNFLASETGIFQNGSYQKQEEEDEIIGQFLSIAVGPDGKLVDWGGLEDIESDESGIDQGEMMANNYASIFFNYFPTEPIKVGSTWKGENPMDVTTKEGNMHQITTKTYTVQDFVEKDGHPCVKCKIKIVIDNTGEGTATSEGKDYHYYNEGRGEGNGTVYFDFKSGYLVFSTFNWIVDFTITSVEDETQEKSTFTYYQEQKVSTTLVDESDIPAE